MLLLQLKYVALNNSMIETLHISDKINKASLEGNNIYIIHKV